LQAPLIGAAIAAEGRPLSRGAAANGSPVGTRKKRSRRGHSVGYV